MEADDDNNVGVTYFSVRNGEIAITGTPPLCTVHPDTGQVGATFSLKCSRFGNGEKVDVYWANTSSSPLKTVTASSSGGVSASLVVPESELGNHFVVAKGRSSGKQAAAPFNTAAILSISPSRGVVGTSVKATLRGFSSGETVTIRYQQYPNGTTTVATVKASSIGSASAGFAVPISEFGAHTVRATGNSSGATSYKTFFIAPSVSLVPSAVTAGDDVGVRLRGFGARENVNITLVTGGLLLGTVTASQSGSTSPDTASVSVPTSLAPGTYDVLAKGADSNASARAELVVTSAAKAAELSPPQASATSTSTPRQRPTATRTDTPSSTPTIAPSPTPTATSTSATNAAPVADAGEDMAVVDANGDGAEEVHLDGSHSADPDGEALTFEWAVENQVVATDQQATVLLPVGTYTVELMITDPAGATSTDEVIVTVSTPAEPSPTPTSTSSDAGTSEQQGTASSGE
jgi:hypothetical protein